MSARLETERKGWEPAEPLQYDGGQDPSLVEMEALFRNTDRQRVVTPLREAHQRLTQATRSKPSREKRRAAVALQEQWNAWSARRDLLCTEIKRGQELLAQVEAELDSLRSRAEEWAAYERICGKNPVLEYLQSIAAKEHLERFLPGWLRRRQEQLHALNRQMELCARQHGFEGLLSQFEAGKDEPDGRPLAD